jgi:integrase
VTVGLRLRVKDIDFTANHIVVREGKGNKDRITMLPSVVQEPLTVHLARVRALRYRNAACEWGWQWVFSAAHLSVDPRSGIQRRHHLQESIPQRALRDAARRIGLTKPAHPYILRYSSAYCP